jgi:hypothetical protein
MKTKNYKPIVVSFLSTVQDHGWNINSVTIEGEFLSPAIVIGERFLKGSSIERTKISARNKALDNIMAVDDCTVILTKLVDTGEPSIHVVGETSHRLLRIGAYIILGNGADELIADWSYNNDHADKEFSKAHDKFTAKWENKEVPSS